MRNFSNRLKHYITVLLIAVASLIVASCTMTADNSLGSNITPEGEVMVMRHLKFKGNNIIRYNSETDKNEVIDASLEGRNFVETRLYRTDSLLSSNLGKGYMGVRRSDVFGLRTAGFASTILYMNAIDEDNGFGYMPIFDTMKLILAVKNYGGDTLVPIRYKVYELLKPLAENVLKYDEKRKEDSVAYINCDLSGVYDESKPIFEFTFPNSEAGEGPATIMLPMENTDYSWDFVRRLMLIPDNYADAGSDWDGWGKSGIEHYKDDEKWVNKFYGVYIKPDLVNTPSRKEGAIYALDLTASGFMLQGRSRNPQDPTMIKDTVGMYYYFVDNDSKYNASVNRIEHDYSQSLSGGASDLNRVVMDKSKPREERTMVSTCYIEGLGGPATEIYLTDDWLNELLALETSEGEYFSKMGINQCLFTIYIEGAFYDWELTQSNAMNLIDRLNKSFSRVGAYMDYTTLSPIVDYDYVYEKQYETESVFGGYIDRSRGCYVLNMTAHIQQLFNYAKSVRQEDGTFAFNENDKGYVPRTIYIGVEATDPYNLSESALQGMDNKLSNNEAPIQIDLTYTLIK
uniref:DUF4270 family protein n=1 Tax=Alistipes sp. TaxID=1872444 RepID=UPI00405776AA